MAAYKFYCDKDLTNAHSATADTTATYEVLLSQLEKYEELENAYPKFEKMPLAKFHKAKCIFVRRSPNRILITQ